MILGMTKMMIKRQGCTVLSAATPSEAIMLAEENTGKIDLLMIDVIMPEMNGRDLARKLLSRPRRSASLCPAIRPTL